MTDATPLASEQITQQDREAAATLVPLCFGASDLWKSNVLAGYYDDGEVVQAFARHRIAALSAIPAPSDQDASQAQGEVDDCEFCLGAKGGVNGNENVSNGIVVCDYCSALLRKIAPAPGATTQDDPYCAGNVQTRDEAVAELVDLNGSARTDAEKIVDGATAQDGVETVAEWLEALAQDGSDQHTRTGAAVHARVARSAIAATAQKSAWHRYEPDDNKLFCRHCGLTAVRHRKSAPTPTIPAGMVAWNGGSKPADWDGKSVQFRSGEIKHAEPGVVWKLGWDHSYGNGDIIAYTPLAAAPKQAEQQGVSIEHVVSAIKARKAIYETKRDASDWEAPDNCNDYERRDFVVECFDYLLRDIFALISNCGCTEHSVVLSEPGRISSCSCGKVSVAHVLNAPTGAVEKGEAM